MIQNVKENQSLEAENNLNFSIFLIQPALVPIAITFPPSSLALRVHCL
jgi:hypothetical protein